MLQKLFAGRKFRSANKRGHDQVGTYPPIKIAAEVVSQPGKRVKIYHSEDQRRIDNLGKPPPPPRHSPPPPSDSESDSGHAPDLTPGQQRWVDRRASERSWQLQTPHYEQGPPQNPKSSAVPTRSMSQVPDLPGEAQIPRSAVGIAPSPPQQPPAQAERPPAQASASPPAQPQRPSAAPAASTRERDPADQSRTQTESWEQVSLDEARRAMDVFKRMEHAGIAKPEAPSAFRGQPRSVNPSERFPGGFKTVGRAGAIQPVPPVGESRAAVDSSMAGVKAAAEERASSVAPPPRISLEAKRLLTMKARTPAERRAQVMAQVDASQGRDYFEMERQRAPIRQPEGMGSITQEERVSSRSIGKI